MELGFFSMNTDFGLRADVLATALESRGFASLWVGEHSHIPVDRATPYPAGGELPEAYWHMLDPFVSLGQAAAVTTTLRLGTGVCLVLEHDVLDLAKQVATLDFLSGGRVDFGVGVGWNQEELANHTTIPFRQRYRALREAVGVLRACWTQDESSFHGEFFNFDGLWSYPKPAQPTLPVFFGAAGKLGMAHTAEWSDGWCPIETACCDFNPDTDKLLRFRDLGIHQVLIGTGTAAGTTLDSTLPLLDRFAAVIPELVAP